MLAELLRLATDPTISGVLLAIGFLGLLLEMQTLHLAAGVIDAGAYFTGKASGFTNPFSGVAVQITTDGNGGHNRLTIDGIPDDPAERFSGASYTGFVLSPEAVQEVKVQTSIFDAQVTRAIFSAEISFPLVRSTT